MQTTLNTPWQRVYSKFGQKQSEFSRIMGWHRSKVSRALRDPKGLINGKDQETVIAKAKELGVAIDTADLVPECQ